MDPIIFNQQCPRDWMDEKLKNTTAHIGINYMGDPRKEEDSAHFIPSAFKC